MSQTERICLWVLIVLLTIGLVTGTYLGFILTKAFFSLDARIKEYEPILQQLKQIQDEVRAESGLDDTICNEVSAYILVYQASYNKSPLRFKLACIKQESGFNPYAIGPCNEHGLTQIYYPTWLSCRAKGDYHNWKHTLRFGYQLMDDCWRLSRGDAKLAAMFYNGGPRILHRSPSAITMASRHGRSVRRYYDLYKKAI